MSLHYLLDGYNIIPQIPDLAIQRLEEQRYRFVRMIEVSSPQGSLRNEVTVVFDGRPDVIGGMRSSVAKIIFSRGESADNKIKKIVTRSSNKKNIVVVTDDRDIQYSVRAMGAKVIGVQEFLLKMNLSKAGIKRGRGNKGRGGAGGSKYISKSREARITLEFKKIWLNREQRDEGGH